MTEPDPFRENAELIRAFEERPLTGGMKLPDRMLFDLEEARVKALQSRKLPRHSSFVIRHSSLLRMAAVLALLAAVIWLFIPSDTPTARVVITSPGDVINDNRPTIAWTSNDEPGQKYDVWILPEEGDFRDADAAPTLFKAESVISPVAFISFKPGKGVVTTALQPGTDYRVLVCLADAGRMAGVPVTFKVKPVQAR